MLNYFISTQIDYYSSSNCDFLEKALKNPYDIKMGMQVRNQGAMVCWI